MATAGLFSCGQQSSKNAQRQKPLTTLNEEFVDSKYEYTDPTGSSLIIQNSFPKGGARYTDPTGKEYIYAVFWTRITNETDDSCEMTIEFPMESSELPFAPGVYYRLFFPVDTMTIEKGPLYDYGLDLKSSLDNAISKPSSLKRTIGPKGSSAFYVVTLSNKGVNGTLRTGFSLKDQDLFYRINKTEVHCRRINLKKLTLRK